MNALIIYKYISCQLSAEKIVCWAKRVLYVRLNNFNNLITQLRNDYS